jgi:hypothetical protein
VGGKKDGALNQADSFPAKIMSELAGVDNLFQNPKAKSHSADGALSEIDPSVKFLGEVTRADERAESGADKRLMFRTIKGDDFYVYERGNEIWLDVSRLGEGEAGSGIYAALFDYAANTRKVFIGDPAGLSDIALRRRTEAMLSSAIKHGSTDHMQPHARQLKGDAALGVPPLRWQAGDTVGNIQRMIEVSLDSLKRQIPEFDRARYDFDTGTFLTGEGKPLTDGMLKSWADTNSGIRAAGAGSRTIKRGILLNTLAHAEGGERPRLLEQALRQPDQLVAGARGAFYQADTTPNFYSALSRRMYEKLAENQNMTPEEVFQRDNLNVVLDLVGGKKDGALNQSDGLTPTEEASRAWVDSLLKTNADDLNAQAKLDTPAIARIIGVKPNKIFLSVRKARKITGDHDDLPKGFVESLPKHLHDPLFAIQYSKDGYRIFTNAVTEKGEPVFVGVDFDGDINTISPLHDEAGKKGVDRMYEDVAAAVARGEKVYARNKEALAKARASVEGTEEPTERIRTSSEGAAPATIALHRDSHNRPIIITRDALVKKTSPAISEQSGLQLPSSTRQLRGCFSISHTRACAYV